MSSSDQAPKIVRGGSLKLKTSLPRPKHVIKSESATTSTTSVTTSSHVGVKRVREDTPSTSTIVLPAMTKAERALHEAQIQRVQKEIKLLSAKSHKEKISQFNERLAKAPEHNDLFKISYAGTG